MAIKIWGLTGFSGTGKSAALEYLSGEGYPVCDADDLSAEILDVSTPEGRNNVQELKALLGPEAVMESGQPNRPFLRKVIVGNTEQRKKFEGWIFPKIIQKFEAIKAKWEADENLIAFIEGARLVESGYVSTLEGLIVVKANNEVRRKRLIEKRGMTAEEADALISSQDPRMAERQADFMWDNSSTLPELFKQIEVFLMVEDPNS